MEQLLSILLAIKHYSKDIHYSSRGSSFWSDHLLADKIGDDMDGFIDRINEQIYLGNHRKAPRSSEILVLASSIIPPVIDDLDVMWSNLENLIEKGIVLLNGIETESLARAENQLFDDISADLTAKRGLIWRRLS